MNDWMKKEGKKERRKGSLKYWVIHKIISFSYLIIVISIEIYEHSKAVTLLKAGTID